MADVEEPRFTTLAERIAALNQQKNFKSPPPAGKRPPPPPPNRSTSQIQNGGNTLQTPGHSDAALQKSPTLPARPTPKNTAPALPRRSTTQGAEDKSPPLPSRTLAPPLPSRRPSQASQASQSSSASQQISPALPPRTNSYQRPNGRRNSNESDISYISTISNLSLNHSTSADHQQPTSRRLPPTLDQASLPPLPPTRRELEAKAKEAAADGAASANTSLRSKTQISEPPRPSLPPRLPSRPARSPASEPVQESALALPRRLPPRPTSFDRTSPVPARPKVPDVHSHHNAPEDTPPPIPMASRPTDQQIEAAVAGRTASPQVSSCLICRDFSAPDAVAAQYPLSSLPRRDVAGYLAQVLCGPFPSLTDKARAIFTWCHHNIRYDVEGFFGNCIPRGMTPDQTILSGKAVCEGYAKVYQSVAERAGLECVVVCGHGKGYGFSEVAAGDRPPPRDATGHAWNAVRLDDGAWKLLDACWGAGHLGSGQTYSQKFNPLQFTLSNELFGLKHFPEDPRHFYREDGRAPSWEEYVLGPVRGERATWYNDGRDEGLSEHSVAPPGKHIAVRGPGAAADEYVRFQFSMVCEHWKGEVHGKGKPRLLMLKTAGGGKGDLLPLDTDGYWWWIDVPARELGAPGQKVSVFALNTLGDADGRGVTKQQFLAKKGKVGMSWSGIAAWELV